MKHFYITLISLFFLISCAETLEERAKREADEFTKKNCPAPLSRDLTVDSMTFDPSDHLFTYYYSLSPKVDCTNINKGDTEQQLLRQLKNQVTLRKYKEVGYSFRYVYYPLVNPKEHVIDVTFHEKDYR